MKSSHIRKAVHRVLFFLRGCLSQEGKKVLGRELGPSESQSLANSQSVKELRAWIAYLTILQIFRTKILSLLPSTVLNNTKIISSVLRRIGNMRESYNLDHSK